MKRMDPREQFSKWLAKSGAVYWIVCMSGLVAVMAMVPEAATECVYMALIVSAVMIFHVWAYTKNSTYEKGVLAILDKTRMELSLRAGSAKKNGGADGECADGMTEDAEDSEEDSLDDSDGDDSEGGNG